MKAQDLVLPVAIIGGLYLVSRGKKAEAAPTSAPVATALASLKAATTLEQLDAIMANLYTAPDIYEAVYSEYLSRREVLQAKEDVATTPVPALVSTPTPQVGRFPEETIWLNQGPAEISYEDYLAAFTKWQITQQQVALAPSPAPSPTIPILPLPAAVPVPGSIYTEEQVIAKDLNLTRRYNADGSYWVSHGVGWAEELYSVTGEFLGWSGGQIWGSTIIG